jgi:ribonuclease P protein component
MRRSRTRNERLRAGRDIKGLFATGKRVESGSLKLLFRGNGSPLNRFTVVVRRGNGGAVRRNREKRITREAYRSLKSALLPGHDLLFLVVREGSPYRERRSAMEVLFRRAGLVGRAV